MSTAISLPQFNSMFTHAFNLGERAAPPPSASATEAFQAMAQHSRMTSPKPPETDAGALISRMASSQDAAFKTVSDDMLYMISNSAGMSMQQIATASMQVQLETAGMQVDLQSKLAVVTSSKDAIDTLMKNQ